MKAIRPFLTAAAAVLLGSGCVVIPMGSETYRHEYPSDVRPTSAPPTTTCEAQPTVLEGDENRRTAAIGLRGETKIEQPMVQHYKAVSVRKEKRLSVGIFPTAPRRNQFFRPKGSLTPMPSTMFYQGDGKYSTSNTGYPGSGALGGGMALSALTLGVVANPISLLAEIFGPFEKDLHFLGGTKDSESTFTETRGTIRATTTTMTYDSGDIDLLLKFPMAERESIGAWTFHENDAHPHNTFWHGFEAQWVGVCKYCNYFVKDEGEVPRTIPAAPSVEIRKTTVVGPFAVTLSLPSLGFKETVDVEPGKMAATFNLLDAANGDSFANGTVRFLPPAGGLAAIRDEDCRAILELAMEREWPVTVALPAPRLDKVAGAGEAKTEGGGAARPAGAPYQISSIGQTDDGKGLVVRVAVNDPSRTLDIDRAVRPEVRRMFREQFATGENANRRETVRMEVPDGGKTIVYSVTFE